MRDEMQVGVTGEIAPRGSSSRQKWGINMDTPSYLQILWRYKWFLLFGAVVAAAAAFLAGFTLQNGQLVTRAQQTFSATTTMLVTSENARLFQAEAPGVPLQEGVSEPQIANLAESALIYAYIISGDYIQGEVEATTGALDSDTESISGLRRTTQPVGDERFPGRYELPVLEAIGTASTAERAELISETTAAAFIDYLTEQQEADEIEPEQRVVIDVLSDNAAVEGESSNPAIPIVVTFLGVFLGFVVLAFIIHAIRSGIARRRAAADETDADEPVSGEGGLPSFDADASLIGEPAPAEQRELVTSGAAGRARRRIPPHDRTDG